MVVKGKHPTKALSATGIRNIKEPGRYTDGNGLYLVVDPSGAKRWVLRTVVMGKRRDIGLGGLSIVSLADAREETAVLRKIARQGGDPLAERRNSRRIIPTFETVAREVHKEHAASWKNPKHANQWINTLTDYVFPVFGSTRIDQVGTPDVLKVLQPIWLTKPETARRVKQRINTVFDYAKAAGFRAGDNPVDGVSRVLPKQTDTAEHHAALPYVLVADFIKDLRAASISDAVKLAFEFLILTATRTSEVLEAKWSEIDLATNTWTIPANRMKAKKAHRIPLSPRCIAILESAKELADKREYLFPNEETGKALSNMVLLMALRRMGLKITTHGFRSSFRDWTAEQTNFPRDVCEMALAHVVENQVEGAYRRGDLFERRKELMATWEQYCTTSSATEEKPRTPKTKKAKIVKIA